MSDETNAREAAPMTVIDFPNTTPSLSTSRSRPQWTEHAYSLFRSRELILESDEVDFIRAFASTSTRLRQN
jgi:hypothetical protein